MPPQIRPKPIHSRAVTARAESETAMMNWSVGEMYW